MDFLLVFTIEKEIILPQNVDIMSPNYNEKLVRSEKESKIRSQQLLANEYS